MLRALKLLTLIAVAGVCWFGASGTAAADTCPGTVAFNGMPIHSGSGPVTGRPAKLTIIRGDSSWVSYTSTFLYRSSADELRSIGTPNQFFDERRCGIQPFCSSHTDLHNLSFVRGFLGGYPSGTLKIENLTWGFTTFVDFRCLFIAGNENSVIGALGDTTYVLTFGPVQTLPTF